MATIVITGGNRGIGLELARVYVAAGDKVILGLRDPKSLPAIDGVGALALEVGSDASAKAFAQALGDQAVDVLINNAGVIGPDRQSATDMDFDGFAEALNINTLGPLRVTQALLPHLKRAKASKVAIISSLMGSLSSANADHLAYRATKAAVNKLGQGLATGLKADGVAVAVLHPGWVQTDMGGSGADITPQVSAAGIRSVLDGLTAANTGRFWNYDGKELPW